ASRSISGGTAGACGTAYVTACSSGAVDQGVHMLVNDCRPRSLRHAARSAMMKGVTRRIRYVPGDPLPEVARLPHEPGVYRFRDERGRALYVGRATDLRRRVRSY